MDTGLDIPDNTSEQMSDQTEPVIEEEPEPEPEEVKPEPVKKEPVKKPVVEEKKVTAPATTTKTETKPKTAPVNPPATKTSQPITKPATVASTDGKHLVIVGNFLQRENADQRLQELKKAGYNDVEVVNFDLSEYHTVCAGRFDDINEARRLVKKLKDYHKIDAYVRIGS
jgi:cell division septation protein DedD